MADILPFCGVRYNTAIVGDLADVAAPPYDVISPDEQEDLYACNPKNVVRLILSRDEDRYGSAATLFRQWLADGTLIVDDRPSIYVYHQSFADPVTGKMAPDRVGLVCLLKLEEYSTGKVLPHENTITSHKTDRLNLLRASKAQFESIYGLYSDPDRSVESFLAEYDDREPVLEQIENMIGSTHQIERITDPRAITVLQELLRDKPIFIADGHHRYETSLNYRREVRATDSARDSFPSIAGRGGEERAGVGSETPPPPVSGGVARNEPGWVSAADYILITLTAFEDEGLLVLPTHRMVKGVDPALLAKLPALLASDFHVEPVDRYEIELEIVKKAEGGQKAIGIILPEISYLATLKAGIDQIPSMIDGLGSDALKQLDVTVLQRLILQDRLGITPDALAAGNVVTYTRSIGDALCAVDAGHCQAAFILGRPSVDDVRNVSLAGDKMPQKSTFFYPKLLSGLILRDLVNDATFEELQGE